MQLILEKYHALGNDYLVYDPQKNALELTGPQIQRICHRNYGPGSDGILTGPYFEDGQIRLRIFNPDGGEAEKSGSGVRIFAKYLKDFGYLPEQRCQLQTLGGAVDVSYLNEEGSLMRVMMGQPTFLSTEIPVAGAAREVVAETMRFGEQEYSVTCVSVGNPHCVIPLPTISAEQAHSLGPLVENAACFPNRINMQLMQILDRQRIRIEIYERGAGYTLASGTSSCAAACAAYRLGLTEPQMTVEMPGGELQIELTPDNRIYMTGKVQRVGGILLAEEFVAELQEL